MPQDTYKNLAARIEAGYVGSNTTDYTHVKKVAVVGGGVAGLQTARALQKLGKEVTIFEKSTSVGCHLVPCTLLPHALYTATTCLNDCYHVPE